jgi:hypothetical protein
MTGPSPLTKQERLRVFIERLERADLAGCEAEAFGLIHAMLNGVEDELSGIPSNPDLWLNDGRMYPPQSDAARVYTNASGSRVGTRYRSRADNTIVGNNGSIKIVSTRDSRVHLDKPGQDGLRIDQL